MSTMYTTTGTFTVNGIEEDMQVRCRVDIEWDHGHPTAEPDGGVEVWRGGYWLDAEDLFDTEDLERATDALCEMALTDDTEECEDDERQELAFERWEDAS